MTLEMLLGSDNYLSYLLNRVPLFHPLHPSWFHMIIILEFLFNYFDDYNTCIVCHELQDNILSDSTCEEFDSIIQSICSDVHFDLSLLTTNQESDVLINPSSHDSASGDCHSTYHFLITTLNDSCVTSFDIYGLRSC